MVTTRAAVAAIARHLGFDPPRVSAVARRLTEAGVIPSGSPKNPPVLGVEHVVDIMLASAIEAPLRAVADEVVRYRALTPGGADLTGAPASIDTAGQALDIIAEIAVRGESDILRRDLIEVVSNFPEIAIHASGHARRFAPVGALASHWQASGHRRSTTIPGAALVDCLRELFKGN